jgi:hypothetical protein
MFWLETWEHTGGDARAYRKCRASCGPTVSCRQRPLFWFERTRIVDTLILMICGLIGIFLDFYQRRTMTCV